MFKIGDVVRYDKAANKTMWETMGKRGRRFEVVAVMHRKGVNFYNLMNTITRRRYVVWTGESLIKKAD